MLNTARTGDHGGLQPLARLVRLMGLDHHHPAVILEQHAATTPTLVSRNSASLTPVPGNSTQKWLTIESISARSRVPNTSSSTGPPRSTPPRPTSLGCRSDTPRLSQGVAPVTADPTGGSFRCRSGRHPPAPVNSGTLIRCVGGLPSQPFTPTPGGHLGPSSHDARDRHRASRGRLTDKLIDRLPA